MYNFEILSEYHLSQEHIVKNSQTFLGLFNQTLQENDVIIKVASLKAITSFLSSIDDTEEVIKYKSMMEGLLDVVI
jgi:molecular chaperone GrpE (heat shock protein)